MFEKPKVDILMATYNGEKYLATQIQSLIDQTYDDFRLIISDDNSTDNTRKILLKYSQLDDRIELIFNEENVGVIKNFEKLLSLSKADYFMLCDQDDVWHENKVKKSIEYIKQKNALLVYTDLRVVNEELREINPSFWSLSRISPVDGGNWKLLLNQNIVTGCTITGRAEIKDYALPFPEFITMHDAWLAIIASVHGQIDYISETLIDYRQHQSNVVGAQIGIMKFLKEANNGYNVFSQQRYNYITDRLNIFQSYLSIFIKSKFNKEYREIIESLIELIEFGKAQRKIKYFDFSLSALRMKMKYPSQLLSRSIWWVMFGSFPFLAYIMLRLVNNTFVGKRGK